MHSNSLKNFTTSQNLKKLDKDKTPKKEEPQKQDDHMNLFDRSILTSKDWTEFKAYFDKNFPGYVKRLRDAYPAITESEERLFFLLKLQLKSKEISNLLGISVNSVKKTRNRLRKKLPLRIEDNLEDFVQNF